MGVGGVYEIRTPLPLQHARRPHDLAVRAYGTARSDRATAEAVLSDYAGIAAAESGRIAREHLPRVFDVVVDEIPRRMREGRMPDPVEVRSELDDAADAIRYHCPVCRVNTDVPPTA